MKVGRTTPPHSLLPIVSVFMMPHFLRTGLCVFFESYSMTCLSMPIQSILPSVLFADLWNKLRNMVTECSRLIRIPCRLIPMSMLQWLRSCMQSDSQSSIHQTNHWNKWPRPKTRVPEIRRTHQTCPANFEKCPAKGFDLAGQKVRRGKIKDNVL